MLAEAEEEQGFEEFLNSHKDFSDKKKKKFAWVQQHDEMDCAAACMAIISLTYGRRIKIATWRSLIEINREGVSMLALQEAVERVGFKAMGIGTNYEGLETLKAPFIAVMQYHYVVVHKVKPQSITVADPASGLVEMSRAKFEEEFSQNVLAIKPTEAFFKYPESQYALKKYFKLITEYRSLFFELVLISILMFLFSLTTPLLMQYIFDFVLKGGNKLFLNILCLVACGIFIFTSFTELIRTYLLQDLASRIEAKLSAVFVRHVLKLPLKYFSLRNVGDVTTRLDELKKIRQFVTAKALSIFLNFLSIGIYSLIIFFYSWTIFLVIILSALPLAIFVVYITSKMKPLLRESFKASGKSFSIIYEQFNSIATIRSLRAAIPARWRWLEVLYKQLLINKKILKLSYVALSVANFFKEIVSILVLLVALHEYQKGNLTLGQVVALTMLVSSILQPMLSLMLDVDDVNQFMVALERVDEVMTAPAEVLNPHKDERIQIRGDIEFKDVSFQYGGDYSPQVLDGLNLKIKAGEVVAIVGPSGSGKTTIGSMINLLYTPNEGEIYIDGMLAKELPTLAVRNKISMVLQENGLFSGTILENIALGDSSPSMERIYQICKDVEAYDFIMAMPEGFLTKIQENGEGLSGGQRQRIKIARALYRNPSILILDEATSALDNLTEQTIVKTIQGLAGKCTTIIIAHRLNTVLKADRILVLDKGQIKEDGNHRALMNQRGIYFDLFKNQLT
jgi:ATP-binding cassette, subfamily B, bacterial HlyB/CyaB